MCIMRAYYVRKINLNFFFYRLAGGRLLGGKNHFPPRTFRAITSNLHIFPGGKRVSCSYIKVLHMLAVLT